MVTPCIKSCMSIGFGITKVHFNRQLSDNVVFNNSFRFSSHAAGDVVMVQPSNLPGVVEEFIRFLGLDPNRTFTLAQNDPGNWFICTFFFSFSCTSF